MFARYPNLLLWIGVAVFVAAMLIVHTLAAPYIVSRWGTSGTIFTVLALVYVANLLDRY